MPIFDGKFKWNNFIFFFLVRIFGNIFFLTHKNTISESMNFNSFNFNSFSKSKIKAIE